MTEPQNTTDHRAPLAPGEIRTHTVGDRTFQVMHVAGGSFTQATVRTPGRPTEVLRTDTNTAVAVRAYADAIAAAEAVEMIAKDALTYNLPDGADMTLVTGEPIRPTPQVIAADPGVQVEYATDVEDEDDPYAEREASAAFNINVLRGLLHGTPLDDDVREAGLTALDRIAAQMPAQPSDDTEALAALESLAVRTPVRATDNGGQPLWIRDGIVGANGMARDEWMIEHGWKPLYILGGEVPRPFVPEFPSRHPSGREWTREEFAALSAAWPNPDGTLGGSDA